MSETQSTKRAIGLMSGTSLDGIDAALIETDGQSVVQAGPSSSVPYPPEIRHMLGPCLGARTRTPDIDAAEQALTQAQAQAVLGVIAQAGLLAADIDVVGFHGQTITHVPPEGTTPGWTWQLGDGQAMADTLGLPVIYDFRAADMAVGGQGAPFAPLFHRALAAGRSDFPVCFLNIGGVSNLTYLADALSPPIAFDTGPGNAPIDDLVGRHLNLSMDAEGRIAASGTVDQAVLDQLMRDPYFSRAYPKSLDRNAFDLSPVDGLPMADAAATLVAFLVECVAQGADLLPARPARWFVTGGGRRNPVIMAALAQRLAVPVDPVEAAGGDGDVLEAQAFAYLAVRASDGLPTSYPETTGAAQPTVGGVRALPLTAR
jgi:anhydro-N-acetylmuramic acid kinase